MKTFTKAALFAAASLSIVQAAEAAPARAAARPAAAPAGASTGQLIPGLAVADFDAVVNNSDAVRAAQQQRPTTYKAQIDAYQSRAQALQAQLQPMVDKFNRDKAAANANQADLQTQAAAIQKFQQNAQTELNAIVQPVAYSEMYVKEQVEGKLEQAIKTAMAANRVSIILNPQAVVALNGNAYNLNMAIIAELNKLIPTAQLVPPAGWEPRDVREAKAQQQAQQKTPAAAAPAPAAPATTTQPSGR